MDIAISAIPIIGLYLIVICYHLTSYFGSHWVREALAGTAGTVPAWKMAFQAATLASAVAWCVAGFFSGFAGMNALNRSCFRRRSRLVFGIIALWCIVQPIVTSLTLPQAMSLLVVEPDADAAAFVKIFQGTRLGGFVSGLAVAFALSLLVLSLSTAPTWDQVARTRKTIKQGIWIYLGLVLLGAIRLAMAQRAVILLPKGSTSITAVLNIELIVYVTYYSMMSLIASYGAMFGFNLQVERLESKLGAVPADLAFKVRDLGVGLASFLPVAIPVLKSAIDILRQVLAAR